MYRMNLYNEYDFNVKKAKGVYIYDTQGNKYLDTYSGIGVMALGHSYPEIIKEQEKQIKRYEHISNFFVQNDAEEVASVLVEQTGRTGQVFFTNSGTEAVEAALKAVKKKTGNNGKRKIITFNKSFHGRTLGALSLNGFENLRAPFEPLLADVIRVEFNDVVALNRTIDEYDEQIGAIFIEPVLGSGGVQPMTEAFAAIIDDYCLKNDILLISDEIQAGLGRTGQFYSYQHYSLHPDMITVGKPLGGGLPLGATVFLNGTEEIFQSGDHGSTFAPNPVSIAGGKIIVHKIPGMLKTIQKKGRYFKETLMETLEGRIKEIRQIGLMIGLDLETDKKDLRERASKNELLINVLKNNTIRLLPAFTVEYHEMDEMAGRLREIL